MKIRPILFLMSLFSGICGFAQNYNIELRSELEIPNQTLGNVWGYVQDGKEYALLGGQLGLIIVDVTDPENPVQIVQIPGPDNLWKEVKTYQHYAYATTEGGPVQVIDLSPLPSSNLPVFVYDGDGPVDGMIQNVHALHVDVTKGFLYLYGATSAGPGGAIVCDLKPDPFHPTYAGEFQSLNYIHDGFVDNDTLYGGHINDGYLSIVNMTDKQNPEVLGTILTPNEFTHNTWPTDDRKTVLTTDERFGSYLTAFDVSNPSNIVELDRFQCTPGSMSVPHNTHILNDYAVTAWYTDGVNIVDASNPSNLVQVGWYDTYTGNDPSFSGPGYNGCWGVYPFLPSGNLIATNIPKAFQIGTGKMLVLTPTYVRASWLEGVVTNALTGDVLSGVGISINGPDPLTDTQTNLTGEYKTGQATPGTFQVTFLKDGFDTKTIEVELQSGVVNELDVALYPEGTTNTTWLEGLGASLQVAPNVFSTSTNIAVVLPETSKQAELRMTSATGQVVWTKKLEASANNFIFDENLPSGTYFLSLHVGNAQTKAVQLQKVD